MPEDQSLSALKRKAGADRGPLAPGVMTAARAFHLVLPRVADELLGLSLAVVAMRENHEIPEEIIDGIDGSTLLLLLRRSGAQEAEGLGLAILDAQLLAGLIEIQTLGRIDGTELSMRTPTATDAAIVTPFLVSVLAAFDEETETMSRLPPWAGIEVIGPLPNSRAAFLALPTNILAVSRLSIDLEEGKRRGEFLIAMPKDARTDQKSSRSDVATPIGAQLDSVLMECQAELEIVLHRLSLPFRKISEMKRGTSFSLPDAGLDGLSVEDTTGSRLAFGHLGQTEGIKAVRLCLQPEDDATLHQDAFSNSGFPSTASPIESVGGADDNFPLLPDLPETDDLPELETLPQIDNLGSGDEIVEEGADLPELATVSDLPPLPDLGDLPDLPDLPDLESS